MSTQIEFVVEWTVSGDAAAFKRAARKATEMVRRNEPGALRYVWYADSGRKTFLLTECYVNSEAMLAHGRNVASVLPELEAQGRVTRFEILGDLSPEAEKAATALGARRLTSLDGLVR